MTEVFAIVEGQTEEAFVNDVLQPHLLEHSVYLIACLTGTRTHRRTYKGGIRPYPIVRADVTNTMKEHTKRGARVTTMLDLYALQKDFPGYTPPGVVADPYARAKQIEDVFGVDIADHRFIPYIQVHEFEALLFTDPGKFVISYPNAQNGVSTLSAVADEFGNPEHIDNDSPPSKRIRAAVPGYDKVAAGPIIAQHIGLPTIRSKCPHFDGWLTQLEGLGT